MKVGDLVMWLGKQWLVTSIERHTRSALLSSAEGTVDTIAADLDQSAPAECQVLCNPMTDWPFIIAKPKQSIGRLLSVLRPDRHRQEAALRLFSDWVVPDARQIGGAVFMHPSLRLRVGEVLVFVYEKGRVNVTIPRNFGTTQQRIARVMLPDANPRTSYDRLLDSSFEEDDKEE